jgi:hypothetical protein
VYLLEPWQESWDSPKVLAAHAQEIVERELAEWTTKRSRWPKKRGLNSSRSEYWLLPNVGNTPE